MDLAFIEQALFLAYFSGYFSREIIRKQKGIEAQLYQALIILLVETTAYYKSVFPPITNTAPAHFSPVTELFGTLILFAWHRRKFMMSLSIFIEARLQG